MMITTRRSLLGGLASLFAAPAIVRADSLMKVHNIPERYATVWGVGWDLEVVEHVVWTPQDALGFAKYHHGGLEKFREVTEVVYTKPLPPLVAWSNHWTERPRNPGYDIPASAISSHEYGKHVTEQLKENGPIVREDGTTRLMGFREMKDWRASLREDLDGVCGPKWIEEQIRLNEANGAWKYDNVPYPQAPIMPFDYNKPTKFKVTVERGTGEILNTMITNI